MKNNLYEPEKPRVWYERKLSFSGIASEKNDFFIGLFRNISPFEQKLGPQTFDSPCETRVEVCNKCLEIRDQRSLSYSLNKLFDKFMKQTVQFGRYTFLKKDRG